MLEYNPNKPIPTYEYATYIPGRRPEFKAHRNRGLAHSAMGFRYPNNPSILYHWNGEKWDEIDRYEPPETCWYCKTVGMYYSYSESKYLENDKQARWHSLNCYNGKLERNNFIPQFKAPVVCGKCRDEHWGYNAKDPLPFPTEKDIDRICPS